MVTAAYNDLGGPTKESFDFYDIDHGIKLLPKLEEAYKEDFSKERSYGKAIDILGIPDYELDVNEEYHRKIR